MSESAGYDLHTLDFLKRLRPFIITAHSLAIGPTIFRLYHRCRTGRLWWDDFWALFALTFDILLLSMYLGFPITHPVSDDVITVVHWATMIALSFALWAARISVGVTIVRLLNPSRLRVVAKGMMILFGMAAITLLVEKLFICGRFTLETWKCTQPPWSGILEIVTDVLSDTWLVIAPAYMVWQMKLPRRHFRLLQFIFACSVFVTAAGVTHGIFIIKKRYLWMTTMAHFEIAISLIVCNLLVVITYFYKVFWSTGRTCIESTAETLRVPTDPQCAQLQVPSIHVASSNLAGTCISSNGPTLTLTEVSLHTSDYNLSNPSNSQISACISSGGPTMTLTEVSLHTRDYDLSNSSNSQTQTTSQNSTSRSNAGEIPPTLSVIRSPATSETESQP